LAGSLCGQLLPPVDRRLVIRPANLDALGLEPWHAYDLVLGQARLSVLCREGDLISLDNLRYLARQPGLGRDVKECLVQRPDLAVEEPVGHGSPNRLLGRLVVSSVVEERTPYLPAIPILAEPRTFMALLPAAEALRVAQAIAQKYGREMGKVCHRLALTLGLVYFGRRMPLAAALDAGRHMLDRPCDPREAGVRAVELQECSPEGWPARVALRLAVGEREVRLTVPTVMGDGKTPDVWYPYWRLVAPADGGTRCREFLGPDGGRWVHVADLRPADRVQLVPSTFDYEHLDVAARRYEVAYDGGHRRGADRCHRPYLLEELADLERVWQLAGPPEAMATSQAVGLVALVEAKRTAWGLPRGDEALKLGHDRPFATFCRDALATLAWRRRPWKGLPEEDRHLLERAALSGMLADVLELHLTLGTEGASEEEERCILSGVSS
ncbi:MAG: CRISPR-associated protein Csx11, partial [Anaerolineae bacterium]|nr:CRISPR-associated protein Csx11 [Anaerolineae bacterium]